MDLTKMFVLVPSTSAATVEAIKTASVSSNKIYFMAKYNQIVAKGAVYGVDPSTGKELETLVSVLGGTKADDGTVSVDFSGLNYYASEGTKTIIGAIKALDAKIKAEMDKLAASNTLNDSYEFTGSLQYKPAAEGVAAHIALVNEAGTEISTIAVSDIIGNGVLKSSAYDAATGILTLTFAQADGTSKAIEVDLKAMLDINDISIEAESQNYLKVTLGTADAEGDTQAVFGAKIVKVAEASDAKTGLADAKDVKDYVDSKAYDLEITAEGDDYVAASVVDKKHVVIASNVQDVTYTAGTHATYDLEGAKTSEAVPASISGVAKSLVDGAKATAAIKSYVDFVVAEEALRADAKVLAAVKALDKASSTVDGSNVHVTYKEEDGIVTIESIGEDYATVNHVATTSTPATPKTDASLTVTGEDKLVKGSDLKAVADYAADKVTEEAHRVDKKIAALAGDKTGTAAGVSTQVTTAAGEVSGVVVSVADNAVTSGLEHGSYGSRTLTVASADNVIKGQAIAAIKDYVDGSVADLSINAEGDDYIWAQRDLTDWKKIKVEADVSYLTVTTFDTVGSSTLDGTPNTLADAGDVAGKVSTFVNARIAEEIKKLDVDPTEVSEAGEGAIKFTYSETDGKVAISNLSATYASHSADAHTLSTGIVNGTVLNSVLADMWETYVDA